MAFGAFDGLGIHPYQLFGNLTALAFELVDRHFPILSLLWVTILLKNHISFFARQFKAVFQSCQALIQPSIDSAENKNVQQSKRMDWITSRSPTGQKKHANVLGVRIAFWL
jgi:hypothetical protein